MLVDHFSPAILVFPFNSPHSISECYGREGRGTMVRAWNFANVTACRAVSHPAWYRIFNIGILFRCCLLEQGTSPLHASLDSGVNEYLEGQRWQCVRLVPMAEVAASVVCYKKGVEMVYE